jgi:S-adenosylmethionine-dependent methyltransferase
MTDFRKVEAYYNVFDEWNRLDTSSGKLEFILTKNIIMNYLKEDDVILDLGGGPGRYSIEFASLGYLVHLADLSEELLKQAEQKINEYKLDNIKSISKVNAIDLSLYEDEIFDVVLVMGPLYHLTTVEERTSCLKEVFRVLKPNGKVIASYIPYLSGSIGIVDRYFYAPTHVNKTNLKKVFDDGTFNNNSSRGFQEGYYPTTIEIERLFIDSGFIEEKIRSVRGFGFGREEEIIKLMNEDKELYDIMIDLIDETSADPAIIETCAHAVYIGRKI